MKKLTVDQVIECWLDTPLSPVLRQMCGPEDWGDPGTIKVHLKRPGATGYSPWSHFGQYLGQHSVGFVVAIKSLPVPTETSFYSGGYAGGEAYETIEEMKQNWQLD